MTDDSSPGAVSADRARELLREMVRIRRFENRVATLYEKGDIAGFMHVSNGHEASHVGIAAAREERDWWAVGGARVHGQVLAAGVPMREVLAEVLGKKTGTNRGKGGHMHVSDVDRHVYGSAATIGQGYNPAAGLALSQQMLETGQAVVATVGDGGTSRGTFHTALNLASYWDLPVVFIIENNRFSLSFNSEAELDPENLADHAESYGIPGVTIDGTDVERVRETVGEALDRAKAGDGPTLIEHKLHRLEGHYVGDKEQYRSDDIEDVREQHDPVANYREQLLADDRLTENQYDELVADVDAEIEAAVEFARESEFPDRDEAYDDLYNRPLYGQEGN